MPEVKISGINLHYEDLGAGDPLLFIPGALGTGRSDFSEQLTHFSQRYRVIAPDLRGYGQSRPPDRDYPLNFYQRDTEDILALVDALGLTSFRIMGWSDGANVAALLAANYPALVRQLVIWAGNSFISDEEISTFRSMRSIDTWSPRARAALQPIYGESLGGVWANYVAGLERIYAAGGNLYRDQLAGIQAPTFILHGDKDPLVPAFHPAYLHTNIHGSLLHRFPEGKHNIHVKYASEFNHMVLAFFDAQYRSAAN